MAKRGYKESDDRIPDSYFSRPAGNGGRVEYAITRNEEGGDACSDPDSGIFSGMTKRMALQGQGFAPLKNRPHTEG